jgi:hypothetical protein
MKTCIRCKIPKSLDEFGNYSRYADGKHRYCRTCWNALVNDARHAKGAKPIPPFLERLWGNIQQCGHEETCVFCCWPWQKALDQDGYGKFSFAYAGRNLGTPVARVIYEMWHAVRIPDGMLVCHYCDNPPCCNPLHLWIGSLNDNRQDCVRKGRTARGLATGWYTKPVALPHIHRLTSDEVIAIRQRYKHGNIAQGTLAREYHVSKHTIRHIVNRETWKHLL